jgi:hypothetical protein
LIGFGGFWFGFFGYDLVVKGEVGLASVIGTVVFVGLACLFTVLIIKGGKWTLEVTQEAVHWHCPLEGDRTVSHVDVESFEVVAEQGRSPVTYARLKTGERVVIPSVGDQRAVHEILLTKWKYLGKRYVP